MKFAAGAQFSRQNLTAVPDLNTANNLWIDSPTILPFNANREITSYYAEVEIPIVDKSHPLPGVYSMALGAAGRFDDYSGGVGSSKVPKVDLKYQPFDDQLTLRASAGKSFIAPPLYALYGPTTQGSSSDLTYTGANGTQYTNVQMQASGGSNPNLQPSTATTWEAGFTYTPNYVANLSVSADYFDTTQHKIVGIVDETTIVQSVEDLGAASPFASQIRFGSPRPGAEDGNAAGQISSRPLASVFILDGEVNLSSLAIKGYDVAITYVVPTKTVGGRFEVDEALTAYSSYLIRRCCHSENYYQHAGHVDEVAAVAQNEGGTTPRYPAASTRPSSGSTTAPSSSPPSFVPDGDRHRLRRVERGGPAPRRLVQPVGLRGVVRPLAPAPEPLHGRAHGARRREQRLQLPAARGAVLAREHQGGHQRLQRRHRPDVLRRRLVQVLTGVDPGIKKAAPRGAAFLRPSALKWTIARDSRTRALRFASSTGLFQDLLDAEPAVPRPRRRC